MAERYRRAIVPGRFSRQCVNVTAGAAREHQAVVRYQDAALCSVGSWSRHAALRVETLTAVTMPVAGLRLGNGPADTVGRVCTGTAPV